VECHGRDTYAKSAFDEVEGIVPAGVGMGQDELSNGSGVARQQFAVRSTGHTMVRCLNDFLGAESLLPRSRRPADRQQPSNLGHPETQTAMQEKMAEHPRREIILAGPLAEAKRCLQDRDLLDRQTFRSNTRLREPSGKRPIRGRHERASMQLEAV
jgi:hypothetical protein